MSEDGGTDVGFLYNEGVSAKMREFLVHKNVIKVSEALELTLAAGFDGGWIHAWSQYLQEKSIAGTEFTKDEMQAWRNGMAEQWNLFYRKNCGNPVMFATLQSFFFPEKHSQNFWSRNKYWYVSGLVTEGKFAMVCGQLGSGKTDFALLLSEILIDLKEDHLSKKENSDLAQIHRELQRRRSESAEDTQAQEVSPLHFGLYYSKGIRFVSNVRVPGHSPYSKYFTYAFKLTDINIAIDKNALDDYYTIVLFDEMGISYSRRRQMSNSNLWMEQFLKLIRKKNSSLIVVTQEKEDDLPDVLLKKAQTVVEKKEHSIGILSIENLMVAQRIHSIPRTRIPFSTRAGASVLMDVNPKLELEEVAAQEALAHNQGRSWTDIDAYRADIAYCEKIQKLGEGSADTEADVLTAQIKYYLGERNPVTGKMYSVEEVSAMMQCDRETVLSVKATMKDKKPGSIVKA